MNTLSVCIIAKDEEKNIARCLKSVKDIADEIIVVDTGSCDNTSVIAKKFNARVIDFKWCNNFSEARNISLEMATKDWVLYLDCDEALDITQTEDFKKKLYNTSNVGFCLKLINIIDNSLCDGPYLLRVIKNGEGFRFNGRIHEQILPSIYKKYSSAYIENLDLNLYHYGYDLSESEAKVKNNRNLDILLSFSQSEKDGFYYYNLANQYFISGEFYRAIHYYDKAFKLDDNEVSFKIYIPLNVVKCYYNSGDFLGGVERGEEFLEIYADYKDLYFLIGKCYKGLNENDSAKESFKTYLKLSNKKSPIVDSNTTRLHLVLCQYINLY
ncbi:MAG: tetratricopeptide repeat-containing glycosyltransferase family 2 protein [Clostridium sp.]